MKKTLCLLFLVSILLNGVIAYVIRKLFPLFQNRLGIKTWPNVCVHPLCFDNMGKIINRQV